MTRVNYISSFSGANVSSLVDIN